MKIFSRLIFAAINLILLSSPMAAWDETGHKITGYIAWQRMSSQAREQVIRILLKAPEDSTIPAFYTTYVSQDQTYVDREFFMLMSTWADMVKDRNLNSRHRKYNRSNWHYSDTFWSLVDGRIQVRSPPEDGGLALEKMKEFAATIRGSAPDAEKAIAIAWLEHVIGDIHQPLHTSARVTDNEPKGDQGGNLFLLTPAGTPRESQRNLHSYWDGIIGDADPNSENKCDPEYVNPAAEKIMKKHPYRRLEADLAPGMFEKWVQDSLVLAQREVFSSDLVRFQRPSDKYRKKALRLAERQLALAGYRIGHLFDQAFTSPQTLTSGQ